jgi:AraC-like DNA-binding protein
MPTPDWWYAAFNFVESDVAPADWTKFEGLSMAPGLNNEAEQQAHFKIYSVVFSKDNTVFWIYYGFLHGFLILLSLGWIFYKRQYPKSIKVSINYKAVANITKNENETSFYDYIHQHFDDPDLSLTQIAKASGFPSKIISDTISSQFDTNVKSYINQIRVVEAQRLLQESELNISEIAYKVGFNSPGSFNRVFKNHTSLSPTEYLQSLKK